MAKREAGNFYWGFISLGYHERMAIYALYNFARQVDDEADSVRHSKTCRRASPSTASASRAACAATTATIRSCGSSPRPSSATRSPRASCRCSSTASRWISAARATQRSRSCATYCNLVASVVGRMCVRIFGFSDPVALERADDLGLALQLTNILRDVREDAVDMKRVYLPQDELRRFGDSRGGADERRDRSAAGTSWSRITCARAREYFATRLRSAALHSAAPGGVRADDGRHLRGAAQEDRARSGASAARARRALEDRETSRRRAVVALERVAVVGGGSRRARRRARAQGAGAQRRALRTQPPARRPRDVVRDRRRRSRQRTTRLSRVLHRVHRFRAARRHGGRSCTCRSASTRESSRATGRAGRLRAGAFPGAASSARIVSHVPAPHARRKAQRRTRSCIERLRSHPRRSRRRNRRNLRGVAGSAQRPGRRRARAPFGIRSSSRR